MKVAGKGRFPRLRQWARLIKRDAVALYLAARDPRVRWHAKAVAICVAAYAVSPIDLIPDFVPVLGYLDDLVILPLGIMLAVKLIPPVLMTEFRQTAHESADRPPIGRWAAIVIVMLWILGVTLTATWLHGVLTRSPIR